MKTKPFHTLILLLLITVLLTCCVQADDFDTPDTTAVTPQLDGDIIGIDIVRDLLLQEQANNGNPSLTFDQTNQYISGYVISSDEGGNFFEELIIQDAAEAPTAGVKLLLDVNPLFTFYEFGRKVFVKLDGLTVGFDSGVLSLGIADGTSLGKVPESQLGKTVLRDTLVAQISPLAVDIADFADDKTNLFVQMQEVQFSSSEVVFDQKSFAAEPTDEFDGERSLQDCRTGLSAVLSTSTFADFKSLLLPSGQGVVQGVLTKDFFGEQFNLVINDPLGLQLDEVRCEVCGLAEAPSTWVIFNDDFEEQTTGSPIAGLGWTNFSEAGTEVWEAYSDANSLGISARVGSFNSGDDETISWLITPEINFDNQEAETLNFQTSNSFADQSYLLLLYAQDWDGRPEHIGDANWLPILDANIVADDVFFGDWVESGHVDLSCLTGSGHLAFKFIGSGDAEFDGTFELDEFQIKAEPNRGGN